MSKSIAMKIKGLRNAVGDYRRANAEGPYSPRYGIMYLNRETGELWTVEYYDLGHSWHTVYHNEAITQMHLHGQKMPQIRELAEKMCEAYANGEELWYGY